jgi:hypothetical protein
MWHRLLETRAPAAVVLIRLVVAIVFVSEGQKFLYPDRLGAGRFAAIGIPMPEIMGPFVATVEIAMRLRSPREFDLCVRESRHLPDLSGALHIHDRRVDH